MKTSMLRNGSMYCLAAMLAIGYQISARADLAQVSPIVPEANEQIVRDQLLIVVDESGTIGTSSKFKYEKALAEAFTAAMPDGQYLSGIDSFAGVTQRDWVKNKLAPFSRARMTAGADSLQPLGKTTPLDRSIHSQKSEVSGIGGHGALLVFSDGRVSNHETVLQACRDLKAAHGGELCVFTVQIGESDSGRELLREMAAVNGCGHYYNGNNLDNAEAMQSMARDIFFGHREITPAPAPAPATWNLDNVHFENDVDDVHPKYSEQLDEVAAVMSNNPELQLGLAGHTDSNASNAYNQGLSERRVNAVNAALIHRGVSSSRIETQAHGETTPTVPNTTPHNMHLNRRVELYPIR